MVQIYNPGDVAPLTGKVGCIAHPKVGSMYSSARDSPGVLMSTRAARRPSVLGSMYGPCDRSRSLNAWTASLMTPEELSQYVGLLVEVRLAERRVRGWPPRYRRRWVRDRPAISGSQRGSAASRNHRRRAR